MTDLLAYPIPIEALNRFYFDEVVGQMPLSLRGLVVDPTILRGAPTTDPPIETLDHLYINHYLFIPWLLDDIFQVSEEVRLTNGQAYLLLMIALVLFDQIVDRQMPDIPTIPIAQQHLLFKAREVFERQFKTSAQFWSHYYKCINEILEGLALESDCLDAHRHPYTYQMMQKVCTGKGAMLRIPLNALALASGNNSDLALLNVTLNNLLLVDQLSNDARDWKIDYRANRITLPVVRVLEANHLSLDAISDLSLDELGTQLERHGVLVTMIDDAQSLLKETLAGLSEVGLEQTKLSAFCNTRLEQLQRDKRYYQTISFLGGMSRLLTTSK